MEKQAPAPSSLRNAAPSASERGIRTFGRRHGKKLSARQQWLVGNLLPGITADNCGLTAMGFGLAAILEIGFGSGEHLRELAVQNPNAVIIGAEPFINGVASLLSAITNESDNSIGNEYKNIRVWPDDVRELLDRARDTRFAQVWILHPDPWPKARHEKRRLLNSDFLKLLSSRLAAGGKIIIGTDHHEYYDWIAEQAKSTDLNIQTTGVDVIRTRYQQKNKAGTIAPKYLILSKA